MGHSEGGNMCVLFAATYPERVEALVTYGIYVKRVVAGLSVGADPGRAGEMARPRGQEWGGVVDLSTLAPTVADDPVFARWWSSTSGMSASPQAAVALGRMNTQIDVRGAARDPRADARHPSGRGSGRECRGGALHRGANPGREARRLPG